MTNIYDLISPNNHIYMVDKESKWEFGKIYFYHKDSGTFVLS